MGIIDKISASLTRPYEPAHTACAAFAGLAAASWAFDERWNLIIAGAGLAAIGYGFQALYNRGLEARTKKGGS